MKALKILLLVAALAVVVTAAALFSKIHKDLDNEKLISNWKVCDVHTTSIYTTRGNGGKVRLEWQQKHTIGLPSVDGTPSAGMTDEDLRTCLLMKEDEVK
jgi:hypothetical protein